MTSWVYQMSSRAGWPIAPLTRSTSTSSSLPGSGNLPSLSSVTYRTGSSTPTPFLTLERNLWDGDTVKYWRGQSQSEPTLNIQLVPACLQICSKWTTGKSCILRVGSLCLWHLRLIVSCPDLSVLWLRGLVTIDTFLGTIGLENEISNQITEWPIHLAYIHSPCILVDGALAVRIRAVRIIRIWCL